MSNYSTFLNSSLGKKFQIAISGIFLCLFLFFHLINNLTLFIGPEIFNTMVHSLESIKPIIRIMELGLLIIISVHVFNAIYITISNKKASPDKYAITSSETSTINSRTMIISGTIILLFFIIHLKYFWYTYQIQALLPNESYYDVIMRTEIGYLGNTPTAIFYIISIILIASHLRHGFQSALKTFGILEDSKWKFLYKLSIVFWAIIPALFILIILSIQLNYI
tara:strand:- start:270 stop:938 length:669 start_codon:yes stop_codon:yes gene_type:complete